MSDDEADHRIALPAVPSLEAPVNKGHTARPHHTGLEYPEFTCLIMNYKRLKRFGLEPFVYLDHGMIMFMYHQDPERNGVDSQVDAFGRLWGRFHRRPRAVGRLLVLRS